MEDWIEKFAHKSGWPVTDLPEMPEHRAMAITFGAMLEDLLTSAIIVRLSLSREAADVFFGDHDGLFEFVPLAMKIKIARHTNIIGDTTRRDLKLIKDVRNSAAHVVTIDGSKSEPWSFDSPWVRDKCNALKLLDNFPVKGGIPARPNAPVLTAASRFWLTCTIISATLMSLRDSSKTAEFPVLP